MDPPYWQTVGHGGDFPFESYERMDSQPKEEMHNELREWMTMANEQRARPLNFAYIDEALKSEDIPIVRNTNLILRQIADYVTEL